MATGSDYKDGIGLDTFVDKVDTTNGIDGDDVLAAETNKQSAAIEALEEIVGLPNSTDPDSLVYKVNNITPGISDAPVDNKQYVRKNSSWVELISTGGNMATFDGVLDFLTGSQMVSVSIADPTMTATKIIQPFFTSKLDEVIVLDMKVAEKSRTVGVGFELTGFTPYKAAGQYNVRCIVSGS
jgi:hypothetical protein